MLKYFKTRPTSRLPGFSLRVAALSVAVHVLVFGLVWWQGDRVGALLSGEGGEGTGGRASATVEMVQYFDITPVPPSPAASGREGALSAEGRAPAAPPR